MPVVEFPRHLANALLKVYYFVIVHTEMMMAPELNMTSGLSAQRTEFERETSDLFAQCLQAFLAFGRLVELAEDMRVLSLNAELAAGRAGNKGASVRVLTQYTRELVLRLNSIATHIGGLKRQMYGCSVSAIRTLRQKSIFDRTSRAIQAIQATPDASTTVAYVKGAHRRVFEVAIAAGADMVGCMNELSVVADDVTNVSSQAASISTNIAIEAALSGEYEDEFKQVADAMQNYVVQLRGMSDAAARTMHGAVTIGNKLQQQAIVSLATT